MTIARPGDLVFSFYDTRIQAVGVVQEPAQTAAKPDFGAVGDAWDNEGWLVPVEFTPVPNPIRPKDVIQQLRPHLPAKYSPLQQSGDGNQGVYLAEISGELARVLLAATGAAVTGTDANEAADPNEGIDRELESLHERTDIGTTEKEQLVKARRGQGLFKANLRLHERRCRVTGVDDIRFLIASHMKPWATCSDAEKLDGSNGLLLSPHIDNLFDRGFISFADDGELLISPRMNHDVFASWGISTDVAAEGFNERQRHYLQYHRQNILIA